MFGVSVEEYFSALSEAVHILGVKYVPEVSIKFALDMS